MEGINPDTPKGRMLEYLINNINTTLEILRDSYGAKVRDESDFDYYLKEIRYSPAQDEVLTVFKGVK